MKLYTIRLQPGQDLRLELQEFARQKNIQAGFIITCVGALKCMNLRMSGATKENQSFKKFDEDFEIVSLVGTITSEDCHLHISGSNRNGIVIGGHLKPETIVGVTAEIVVGEDDNSTYSRILDDNTGFEELVVNARSV